MGKRMRGVGYGTLAALTLMFEQLDFRENILMFENVMPAMERTLEKR